MAYPIDGTQTQERGLTDGTSKDLTITLPTLIQDDVYIFAFEVDNGSISTVAGDNSGTWTQQYAASYGGNWMYVYTSIIGATPDTEVTITCTTGNQNYSYASFAVRDADVSSGGVNLIDASTSAQYAAAIGQTAPSLTTVNNDCLVVIAQGVGYGVSYKPREGMYIESQMENSYRSFVSLCSTYQQTAGATGTTKYYMGSNSNRNSQFFVFSIKNAAGGSIGGYVDKSVRAFEYLHLMADDGYSGELGDNTEYDPTSVSNENISSLSNGGYSTSSCLQHPNTGGAQDVVEYGVESWRLYRVSGANGDMLLSGTGITETYGSTDNYDLTGEKIMFSCKVEPLGFKGRSAIGACFGLSDKTNAKFWQVGSFDSIPSINAGYYPTVIDMDDSSFVMDDIGTPNMNNVGAIIWGHEPTSNYVYLHPAAISIMRYITLVGGSSGLPCSFFDAYKLAKNSAIFTVAAQGGLTEGQFFISHDMRIGGSEAVYFDCTNQSCEWPSSYDAGAGKVLTSVMSTNSQ
jgi:hypothetical protein